MLIQVKVGQFQFVLDKLQRLMTLQWFILRG
jgi:hypothetical protein